MPAAGAATGPVGVAELGVGVGVGVFELELDQLGVTTGVEEEKLLDEIGVLEADDEGEELLGLGELLLEKLALVDVEVTTGVEELPKEASTEPLTSAAVELIGNNVDNDVLILGDAELGDDDWTLKEAIVGDTAELLLGLGVLELVEEIVEVTKPEEEAELGMVGDVVELLTATTMTRAPQTPLSLGVPIPLFR
jgi:hypothetical protein